MMKATLIASVSLLGLATISTPVNARQHTAQDANAPSDAFDDIVVTARRVEERLQDVPVAVTALQGDKLNNLGVNQVIEIRQVVPGLNITASSGRPSTPIYAIRGQRASDTQISQDPPVAVYLDEVAVMPLAGSNLGLFDLENVQVLKGPQGTLFGRNTTGGAILFTTAKPTDRLEGSIKIGYGNYDSKTATAVLNMPVNEAIRLRGAVYWTKTDGFGTLRNGDAANPGVDVGKGVSSRDELNLRLTVAIDPTDWLKTTTMGYYSRANNGSPPFHILSTPRSGQTGYVNLIFNTYGGGALDRALVRANGRSVFDAEASQPAGSRARIKGLIHTDTIALDDDLTLKHIFSYRKIRNFDAVDYDGTSLPILDTNNLTIARVYTDEVQLQGTAFDNRLEYVFGVYYYDLVGTDGTGFDGTRATVALGNPETQYAVVKNRSLSGFGQASFRLTDTLRLSAGLRYTVDRRTANITSGTYPFTTCKFTDNTGTPFPLDECIVKNNRSFAEPSWSLGIDKKLDEDTLVYIASRHSYRSGGFNIRSNTVAFAQEYFLPETVTDLELGFKRSSYLGSNVQLTTNLAGFYQWYSDIQRNVSTFRNGTVGNVVKNAAKAHLYGGEAEIGLRFGSLVDLNVNYAFVKPKYDSYPTSGPVLGVPNQPADYSAYDFAYIPRHQINANLTISPDVGDFGKLNLIGNFYYQSSVKFSEDYQNRQQLIGQILPADVPFLPDDLYFGQKGYALVNVRAELNDISGTGLTIAGYVKNLFDKEYVDSGITYQGSMGADFGIYGPPRTYGIEVSYKF